MKREKKTSKHFNVLIYKNRGKERERENPDFSLYYFALSPFSFCK